MSFTLNIFTHRHGCIIHRIIGMRFIFRPIEEILKMIEDGNNQEFGMDRLKCLKKMLPDTSEVKISQHLFSAFID